MARGDLTQKIIGLSASGEMLDLVNTINDMIDRLAIFAAEMKKVGREVGTKGNLEVEVGNVQGIWQEIMYVFFFFLLLFLFFNFLSPNPNCTPRLSVNTMAGNSTTQVRDFARISPAAMDSDFTTQLRGEES